ncbi:acyl-CoA thioesterase II [Pseudomonas saudimassiliensis]|uniref:Acyl-CoA thioesterase 2 n=1 Tax=Pseudomonas saudimassiliensis TaxID=1461581 RepID=A0A078M940_9PSED|nr:acyl-CoA thioesterase II [Pseudomonas saudimassiliensis]CEA02770.1 acyl-CoA thioesterase II [Pseudomonas saudimassiliensis]CEF25939.1 acyl-CoA thioesterase II [Pseudomonas saudimassiliensis]
MSQLLDNLVSLLALEKIEENLFRGRSEDLGFRQLFGGQVLGQALSAASQTVDPARNVHSVHGYFLRPGDASLPIVYHVEAPRDGGSFTTRTVSAIQKGRSIFTLMASFHGDEPGVSHQTPMPDVPGPDGIKSELQIAQENEHLLPEAVRDSVLCPKPIEIRRVGHYNPFNPKVSEPRQYIWFRADGQLPDDDHLHRYLFAYASDFNLLSTAALPHGISTWLPHMQVASLDHAVWFHRPLRMDDWLLYAMDSPSASGARGLSRGLVYNRAGELVASVAQESLMRDRSKG